MVKMIGYLIITLAVVSVAFGWVFYAGRNKEKLTQAEQIQKMARRAVRHRQRLLRDPDYARKLRQKYTR